MDAAVDSEIKKHFLSEFEDVVSDWKHKPKFKARKFLNEERSEIRIYPDGKHKQKWIWVSRGTRGPYKIPKAGPRLLAFTLGYSARTQPKGKSHVGTGKATGEDIVMFGQVEHPGIKAREFEEAIAEKNEKWYRNTMEKIWRRCLRNA